MNTMISYIREMSTITTKPMCEAAIAGYSALFEDAAGKASHKTRKYINETMSGYFDMTQVATNNNGEPILTQSGKKQTNLDYLERQVRIMFFHGGNTDIRFEPGVARIAYGELEFQRNTRYADDLQNLKKILEIISSSHESEYDDNLNGISYVELADRFNGTLEAMSEQEYNEVNSAQYEQSGKYRIVEIHSFEESQQYYEYTNPDSRWCLTHMENMWDRYTENGKNKVFFCLADGFENMPPVVGENCPLDEYGLSMFCVIVTNDTDVIDRPMLKTSTCRWNHDHGGSDSILSVKQISNLIGQSFYTAFPPFTREELHAKGIVLFKDKLNHLMNCIDETNKNDLIDIKEVLIDNNCEYEPYPNDGWRFIAYSSKQNFISDSRPYRILLNKWVDKAFSFCNGKAAIKLNNKFNVIDTSGNLLLDKWYKYAQTYGIGDTDCIYVSDGNGYNYIKPDGTPLCKEWYCFIGAFKNGFAICEKKTENKTYANVIDSTGALVLPKWYNRIDILEPADPQLAIVYFSTAKDDASYFLSDNYVYVNLANLNTGKLLWKESAYGVYMGHREGLFKIREYSKSSTSETRTYTDTWLDVNGNVIKVEQCNHE